MPGLSGLDVLDRVVESDPVIDVIPMTAHYTTEFAVEAIRKERNHQDQTSFPEHSDPTLCRQVTIPDPGTSESMPDRACDNSFPAARFQRRTRPLPPSRSIIQLRARRKFS